MAERDQNDGHGKRKRSTYFIVEEKLQEKMPGDDMADQFRT